MGFSALADMNRRIPDVGRHSVRQGRVTGVVIHYNYGVDSYGEATRAGREVSANYWITNSGVLLPNVDESLRAWTSGAAGYPNGSVADHHSITFEVSNAPDFKTSSPPGAISEAAFDKLARTIGDVFRRYNLGPVKRTTSPTGVGVRVHKDFVDTSCPGEWLMSRMDDLIARAEAYRTGKPTTTTATTQGQEEDEEEEEMKTTGIAWKSKDGKPMYALVCPGSGFFSAWTTGRSGNYNNPIAKGFDTGSFVPVTESHANALAASCALVRGDRTSVDVTLTAGIGE